MHPVVVRPGTYFGKTSGELYCLVGLLTLMADHLNTKHGYALPMETGTFTEQETEFVLADRRVPVNATSSLVPCASCLPAAGLRREERRPKGSAGQPAGSPWRAIALPGLRSSTGRDRTRLSGLLSGSSELFISLQKIGRKSSRRRGGRTLFGKDFVNTQTASDGDKQLPA